jgi:type I restriction-modification system DNA methylase subunit
MERPNITEERFDEIMLLGSRIDSVIDMMCADYDPHERYIIISLLFTKQISQNIEKNSDGEKECERNLIYVRDLMIRKANSEAAKEKKNG